MNGITLITVILTDSVLLFMCFDDLKNKSTYIWMGVLSEVLGVCVFFVSNGVMVSKERISGILSLLLFIALQLFVFKRFYGRADSRAFIACGAVLLNFDMTISGLFIFMIIAYLFLAAAALLKKNISGNLKLKEKMPFLPAIFVSYILCRSALILL